MSVFPDSHLNQRIGKTTKNQNARIAATPKSVTGTQYHLVRLLGVRAQNQIRNPIAARDRTAATIIGNIWKSLLLLKYVPNSFSRDYRLGTASANQITEVLDRFLFHQSKATPVGESITTSLLGYRSFVKDYRNYYNSFGPSGRGRTSTCLVRVLRL